MSILGGGIFKGMAVTLRNFVGSYINKKERLTTNDYSWRPDGDLPQGKVVWTQDSLADLQGRLVHLRFTLRNGSFYSYWIEE